MGRSVYFSFFPFLSARHPPHLTRLFPHPGIFSLSRQLLDHLLQSRNSNVENQGVIKSPKNSTNKVAHLAICVSSLPLVVSSNSNLLSISRIFISRRLTRRQGSESQNLEISLLCRIHQNPCNIMINLTLPRDLRHCHDRDSQHVGSTRPTVLATCSSPPQAPEKKHECGKNSLLLSPVCFQPGLEL